MKSIPTTAHLKGTRTETAHDGEAKVWLNSKILNLKESLRYCSKSPAGLTSLRKKLSFLIKI